MARIAELRAGGTSFLFASHNLDQVVEQCDRAIWLEAGEVRARGRGGRGRRGLPRGDATRDARPHAGGGRADDDGALVLAREPLRLAGADDRGRAADRRRRAADARSCTTAAADRRADDPPRPRPDAPRSSTRRRHRAWRDQADLLRGEHRRGRPGPRRRRGRRHAARRRSTRSTSPRRVRRSTSASTRPAGSSPTTTTGTPTASRSSPTAASGASTSRRGAGPRRARPGAATPQPRAERSRRLSDIRVALAPVTAARSASSAPARPPSARA